MARTMSPMQFVEAECANFSGGGCIWRKKCLISERKRCDYFETDVLPLADRAGIADVILFRDAVDQYRRWNYVPKSKGKLKLGRKCACGESLLPRERVCEKCRTSRRRETYRKAKRGFDRGNS